MKELKRLEYEESNINFIAINRPGDFLKDYLFIN